MFFCLKNMFFCSSVLQLLEWYGSETVPPIIKPYATPYFLTTFLAVAFFLAGVSFFAGTTFLV